MEISEIKKKIIEKIESGKSKSSRKKKPINLATLSVKMGIPEEDVLKLFNKQAPEMTATAVVAEERGQIEDEKPVEEGYRARLSLLEEENSRLKKAQEDARDKSDSLFNQIEEKDRAIAQLQRKVDSESISLIEDDEKEKSLINAAIEKSIAEYRNKLSSLETENENLKIQHAETLKQKEEIFFQIAEKDKNINELNKKFREDIDKLEKDKGLEEKSLEKFRDILPSLESENKKLKKLHEDALKQNDSLLIRIEEKDREISELENKLQDERGKIKKSAEHERAAEGHKAEKEKAVANMEALRSKLYAATKDIKEQAARITQLEETLKHREKKLADSDKVYRNLENEKNGFVLKLQASEEAGRLLEEKLKNLNTDIEAKEKKAAETERLYNKNSEAAKKEMELQIQAVDRNKKALESKIAQLDIELDAKDKRIRETEENINELNNLVKDSATKLHAVERAKSDIEERFRQTEAELDRVAKERESDRAAGENSAAAMKAEIEALKSVIKDKEKSEEELQENISRLESEIESRDKKIQTDIKYCEGVVREVNDLRQKIKAYRLKVR